MSDLKTDFFNTKSREFKDLYYLYCDLNAAKKPAAAVLQSLSEAMVSSFSFPQSVAIKVAQILCKKFSEKDFTGSFCDLESGQSESLFFSKIDFERFQDLTSHDPHITTPIKHLLLALMATYRRNFHRSGWVRYCRKNILYLAGLQCMSIKEVEELTNYLHQEYGLEMQVVGSNSPIPCFKFAWMFDQTQPGSHANPFLSFGEFSPETIVKISSNEAEPKELK